MCRHLNCTKSINVYNNAHFLINYILKFNALSCYIFGKVYLTLGRNVSDVHKYISKNTHSNEFKDTWRVNFICNWGGGGIEIKNLI